MLQFTPLKLTIAVLWLLAVVALGIFFPVTTIKGWLLTGGFGLIPTAFMLRAWRQPAQTMSESIQAQLRD
jgi:hypothetical protein